MKLETFKTQIEKGKVISLEKVHPKQHYSIIDREDITKSEVKWFIIALDINEYRNDASLKKQAQFELDQFLELI